MSTEKDPAPQPVLQGSVFASLVTEMIAMTQELNARRSFDEEVGAFLKQKKLTAKFEAFRKKQST